MTEHLTEDQFQKYKNRKMPTSELLAIGEHLAQCKECRGKLGGSEERAAILDALTRDLQSAIVKDSEQDSLAKHQPELKSETSFAPPVVPQKKIGAVLPRMIRIAAIFILFGLLIAIPFQFQINNLKAQLKKREQQVINLQEKNINRNSQTSSKIELQDGSGEIVIDENGNIRSMRKFLPEQEQLVRAALTDERLTIPSFVHDLAGNISKEKEDVALISPVGTAVIGAQPKFEWNVMPGAKSYELHIYDSDHKPVAQSSLLTDTSWTSQTSLPRGKNYSWTVTAKVDSREIISSTSPASEGKFRILNQNEVDEINRQRTQFADSHLLLALLYAHNGLIDDAEQELRELKKSNPDSAVVDNLLHNLQSGRSNQ